MTTGARTGPSSATQPLSGEAVARLRAHPDFCAAAASSARGSVALHQGGRLINWMLSDRARALLPYVLLYLDSTRSPDDPRSGLTANRVKALCAETGICSAGRAAALFALMRFGGIVAAEPATQDRRVRRFRPTPRMMDLVRARLSRQFEAIAMVRPDAREVLPRIGDEAFEAAFWRALGARFIGGARILDHAPALRLFAERSCGMVILYELMLAGGEGDGFPPRGEVAVSIAELARRFQVSRTHVLRLLRDAEAEGLLQRTGDRNERIALRPALTDAALDMLAAMFLFLADGARTAMAETRGG